MSLAPGSDSTLSYEELPLAIHYRHLYALITNLAVSARKLPRSPAIARPWPHSGVGLQGFTRLFQLQRTAYSIVSEDHRDRDKYC